MPNVPIVIPAPDTKGTVGTPGIPDPPPLDGQATVEQAWWRFMQRIGLHNPKLYKEGGKALDSVNNLMRSS